ncbi:MAG TPA: hypothetical protein VEK08_20025 [Planctomycetota bacterium]|nr:hypothetical protein [Planctomycetota bacterium]
MELVRDKGGAGDEFAESSVVAAERRKLNWSAILAGAVSTIALQMLLMWFGGAVGLSSIDPYQMGSGDESRILPILFLLITGLGSAFFGSWIAGHWANLYAAEDAVIHGALTWALASLMLALGLGSLLQIGTQAAATGAETAQAAAQMGGNMAQNRSAMQQLGTALTYDATQDPQFASFLTQRAKAFAAANPSKEGEAVNVTAGKEGNNKDAAKDAKDDKDRQFTGDDIEDNDALAMFVADNANMTDEQAEAFLKAEKDNIAAQMNRSQQRWQQAHKRELAAAEKARQAASTAAWTMTALALLALAASIGGSYLGWRQRYYDEDDLEDEDTRRGTPMNPPGAI